jgi:hypothetical protein
VGQCGGVGLLVHVEAELHRVISGGVGPHGEVVGVYGLDVGVVAAAEVGPPGITDPPDSRHACHLLVRRQVSAAGAGGVVVVLGPVHVMRKLRSNDDTLDPGKVRDVGIAIHGGIRKSSLKLRSNDDTFDPGKVRDVHTAVLGTVAVIV